MIRDATPLDAPALAALYNPYIFETDISFEEKPLSDGEMAHRMAGVQAHYPWLVCEEEGVLLGYAYATRWKERHAYRYCAETCIYLRQDAGGRGVGSRLYDALLPRLPAAGVQIAIGCIALPNEGSVALHEKFGFEKVGHFPAVGFKFNRWIDMGYWQKKL
tara:strand:+ start:554 stop:1036 length:483 start_codon:yes stop_codon:yes gene_type:complete